MGFDSVDHRIPRWPLPQYNAHSLSICTGHAAHERLGQESHRAQVANILAASSNGFCRHFDRAV